MKIGIICLICAYILSQFYRSFLAVLTPVLGTDLGATASDLSFASGLWFAVFAAMQLPVGWALDKFGPRLTAVFFLAIGGGGGAMVFAAATTPFGISVAMALLGVGGAPVLMATYYIVARVYPPAIFATLAGAIIGFGSIGNLAGTAPLAYAVEAIGWRGTMSGLGIAALVVSASILIFVRDPLREKSETVQMGNLFSLLKSPNLLLLFPLMVVCYAPAAALRGLWAGPYFEDVFGLDPIGIGRVTLLMALAMALGSFAYGPAERMIGSKKAIILAGNLIVAGLCFALWFFPEASWVASAALFTAVGLFGVSFPVIMAHGQMFLPRHLMGRGMTLLNLFGIGGVGVAQFVTGAMARSVSPEESASPEFYGQVFLLFGVAVLVGCAIYAFCKEPNVAERT